MSGNNSSTGGYIQPTAVLPTPLDDDALNNAFQGLVVGITGLPSTLVRPRWQSQPPTQPPVTTDWCAVGVTEYELYDYPQVTHDENGDTLHRYERITILASFYGPDAGMYSSMFRDGLYIQQNLYTFWSTTGIKLRGAEDIFRMPELINSQYVNRSDLAVNFVRFVERTYPILDIIEGVVQLNCDDPVCMETFDVTQQENL